MTTSTDPTTVQDRRRRELQRTVQGHALRAIAARMRISPTGGAAVTVFERSF